MVGCITGPAEATVFKPRTWPSHAGFLAAVLVAGLPRTPSGACDAEVPRALARAPNPLAATAAMSFFVSLSLSLSVSAQGSPPLLHTSSTLIACPDRSRSSRQRGSRAKTEEARGGGGGEAEVLQLKVEMDERTVEANIRLYDSHAPLTGTSAQQMRARESGGAYPLKKYHNLVKLRLLKEFAQDCDALLDLCCGRGGDIHKWINCNVGKVLGVDISTMEIMEAKRRYEEAVQKRPGARLKAKFNLVDCLGTKDLDFGEKFDVVTCMFAIHYFFVSEAAIKQFFRNVAAATKPGGHFVATFPSGKKVLQTLNQREEYRQPMLFLRKGWEGRDPSKPFGQAFECAISDTVTRAETGSKDGEIVGSREYLVFFNVIKALAREVGLELVTTYRSAELSCLFQDEDANSGFKHFKPPGSFDEAHESLRRASELYVATVFRMGEQAGNAGKRPRGGGPEADGGAKKPRNGESEGEGKGT